MARLFASVASVPLDNWRKHSGLIIKIDPYNALKSQNHQFQSHKTVLMTSNNSLVYPPNSILHEAGLDVHIQVFAEI